MCTKNSRDHIKMKVTGFKLAYFYMKILTKYKKDLGGYISKEVKKNYEDRYKQYE